MIVDRINQYLTQKNFTLDEALAYEVKELAGAAFKRQFMSPDTHNKAASSSPFRLSSIGKCPRSLAYAFHGFDKDGTQPNARSALIFWTGDIVELTIISIAALAGCTITGTGLKQLVIKLKIDDVEIEGHPDGMVLHGGKIYLLEIKSMSSYSFDDFQRTGEIDNTYLCQINSYMEALGLDSCVVVAMNKDNGVLHEKVFKKDQAIVDRIKSNVRSVLASTKEALPDKAFSPNDKGELPWNCLYCSYWRTCWPNAEKVLKSNSYKLKLKEK